MPPESCPNCGADVPRNAKACPDCGADEHTGWSESAYASSLGIPKENFNYDKFVEEEFSKQAKPRGISWLWWSTALLLIVLLLLFFFR